MVLDIAFAVSTTVRSFFPSSCLPIPLPSLYRHIPLSSPPSRHPLIVQPDDYHPIGTLDQVVPILANIKVISHGADSCVATWNLLRRSEALQPQEVSLPFTSTHRPSPLSRFSFAIPQSLIPLQIPLLFINVSL